MRIGQHLQALPMPPASTLNPKVEGSNPFTAHHKSPRTGGFSVAEWKTSSAGAAAYSGESLSGPLVVVSDWLSAGA
jgi:hypothetical protein